MDEMALCESVLGILEDQARTQDFSRVETVWLEIGELSCVEPEALRFCFGAVTSGTLAHDAELVIVRTPGQGWCMTCAKTIPVQHRYDACPDCGGYQVEVTGGEEMRIKELEVD